MNSTTEFLAQLFCQNDELLPGSVVISRPHPSVIGLESVWCDDLSAAEAVCRQWSPTSNTYFSLGLQGRTDQLSANSRGTAKTVIALPGFGSDVDMGTKANGKPYPPTIEDAIALVETMPLRPSLLVDSGGGLHPYWLFLELLQISTAEQRDRVARISEGWGRLLLGKAEAHNYKLDSTFDISRVFRPVGTLNHNHGVPRPVRVLKLWPERRYMLDDFAAWEIPDPGPGTDVEGLGNFVIPSATASDTELGEIFQRLLSDPDRESFRQIWERKRKIGDGTPSIYTFAIGCELLRAGASSQEIVDAMVTWRYRHGGDIKSHRWHEQELKRIAAKSEQCIPNDKSVNIPAAISVGGVTLKAGTIRRTVGGKLVISLSVERDEKPVDVLQLTSSASGRSQAARGIAAHVGAGHDVEIASAIAKLLVESDQKLRSAPTAGVRTVRQIVHELVPDEFGFTHRTAKGAWSETRRCEVLRSEFLAYTPDKLVRTCFVGLDCPRMDDGTVKEPELLRVIEVALRIEWATLCDALPIGEAEADDLGEKSEAADRFRQAVTKVWHTMVTFDVTLAKTDSKEPARASKCSLAAKVLRLAKESGYRETGWQDAQKGFAAFWRHESDGNGGFKIVLAMRQVLAMQLNVDIPGVSNQSTLRKLGVRYGVFTDSSTVSSRGNDGSRLVVVSDEMAREILWEPPLELVNSQLVKTSDGNDTA